MLLLQYSLSYRYTCAHKITRTISLMYTTYTCARHARRLTIYSPEKRFTHEREREKENNLDKIQKAHVHRVYVFFKSDTSYIYLNSCSTRPFAISPSLSSSPSSFSRPKKSSVPSARRQIKHERKYISQNQSFRCASFFSFSLPPSVSFQELHVHAFNFESASDAGGIDIEHTSPARTELSPGGCRSRSENIRRAVFYAESIGVQGLPLLTERHIAQCCIVSR